MKRRMGLPWLVLALLLQLFQGSVGPASLAAPGLSSPPAPPMAVQPSFGLSDLSIAARPLPSSVQGTSDAGLRMQVSDADVMRPSHTYFVPFDDTHLWALFEGKAKCHNIRHNICGPLISKVFITAGADNTVYFYDHHEDGYEVDPLNAVQDSTEQGVLDAGVTVVFESAIDPAAIGPDSRYYDGRDRITIVGEEANVVRMANPSAYSQSGRCDEPEDTSGWLAAAWEVLEVDDWGTEYHATVGEDIDYAGNADDHDYAGLEIMAAQDGTTVYYTGREPVTLDAGETYSVPGRYDGVIGVQSSHDIAATAPIQVQMVTGSCTREMVSGHGYTLLPRRAWDNAYWAPVPGFGQPNSEGEGGRDFVDTDIYVHNPDPVRWIDVTVRSGTRPPVVLPIAPNSTVSVLFETLWEDLAEGNEGTYLSSADVFWGVSVIDSATVQGSGDLWDWGYSLIPESQLSSQLIVGHAPGKPDQGPDGYPTDNGNLAFIVAVTDTVVYVDLDQDGRTDPFDIDGDGTVGGQDLWGEPAWDECVSAFGLPVQAGQVLRVGDPFDRNLEGARIFTANLGEHIAGAWGQDPIRADDSAYLDLGYTLLPLVVPRVYKTDGLGLGAGYLPGDVVTYTVLVDNNGMISMSDVVLTDTLPYAYADLLGSAQVTTPPPLGSVEYYDGSQWLTTPTSDTQQLRITWPDMNPQQMVTVTLRVQVHTAIPASVDEVCNQARVTSASTDPVAYEICRPVQRPQLAIDKTVYPASIYPGQSVTYTVVVTNYGEGVGWPTVISDLLPSDVEYLTGTLSLTWPTLQVETLTRTVTQTNVFRGHYADDFDLGPGETTGYGGSDGSLAWAGDWVEVNDDDNFGSGIVQVRVDGPNAFSDPAHAWLGAPSGAASGLARTLDLSLFVSPSLRYYPAGTVDADGDDAYQVTASGQALLTETYTDTYCVREVDLSNYGGQPSVTLGWLSTTGMDAGEFYRLDNVSIHEKQRARTSQRVLSNQVISHTYRALSGSDPLVYDPVSGRMVFTQNLSLPAGETFTLTYQARVGAQPPIGGSMWVTNTSCVTTTHWLEAVPAPPCADAPVRVVQQADLTIAKTDQPDRYVLNGEVLTYTLAYQNLGGEPVQDVFITDTLPNEVAYGGVVTQPLGWSDPPTLIPGPPATLTWYTPTLPAGAIGQIVYTVTADLTFAGTITNNVCISTTTTEALLDNNCDLAETRMTAGIADLVVTKDADRDVLRSGSLLTYTLAYMNVSDYPAENVVVTDSLPAETTFVVADPVPTSTGDPLIWNMGTLEPGEGGEITVTVNVRTNITPSFTNTVCASTTTSEESLGDNCASLTIDLADVMIRKLDAPDPVGREGRQLVYTLVYTNAGTAIAEGVVVTDTLPPGATVVGAEPAPDAGPDPLVWDLGTLAPGQSDTIVLTVTLGTSAGTGVTNQAVIATDTPESDYSNNADGQATQVEIDLAIIKSDGPDPGIPGELLTYTLEYANLGPFDAQEVYITDTFPVGITFAEVVQQPPEWIGPDYSAGPPVELIWYAPALASGTVGRIVYTVLAAEDVPGRIDNMACISSTVADFFVDNNCDVEPTAVQLLYFDAVRLPDAVLLRWETAWEVDSYGFVLLRRANDRQADVEEIALISAAGQGGGGAAYSYLDAGPEEGTSYSYWLVEVDTSGRRTTFGSAVSAASSELPYRVYWPLF